VRGEGVQPRFCQLPWDNTVVAVERGAQVPQNISLLPDGMLHVPGRGFEGLERKVVNK